MLQELWPEITLKFFFKKFGYFIQISYFCIIEPAKPLAFKAMRNWRVIYRFSGYAYSFRNRLDNSSFMEGTSFEQVYSIQIHTSIYLHTTQLRPFARL